jgi:aerobic-type carbon monoxide dehydrogenase small subunit (CoxS/CutS family)
MEDTATPQEVLKRHLELARSHSEQDFLECYRENSFVVMRTGVQRGIEGIRACYRQLNRELPNACYIYNRILVEEDVAFVEWSANSDAHAVMDGIDSYVIQDGYIRAQTIHYTLRPKGKGGLPRQEEPRIEVAVRRGREVEIVVDGLPVTAFEGESVAAALLASGRRTLRTTARLHEPRGMYCGIGVCFDCVMTVDGTPGVQTCQTPVRAGMHVESQQACGKWRVQS